MRVISSLLAPPEHLQRAFISSPRFEKVSKSQKVSRKLNNSNLLKMTITITPTRPRNNSGPRLEIDDDYSEKVRRFSLVLDEQVPKNSPIKKIKKKLQKMLKKQKNGRNSSTKSLFLEKEDSDSEKMNFNISVIHNSSGNSLVFWEESYAPL